MTTGKISQRDVLAQLQRATSTPSTAPATKVEEVASKSVEPENLFGERSKHHGAKPGEGKAVSTTASASKLWGQAAMEGSKPPLNVLTLKNLSPEQAKTKMAELEKKKAGLEGRIKGREAELDHKWRYMHLTKKTTALKEYLASTPNLPPEQRTEVENAIQMSETAQAKVEALKAKVKELEPQPGTKKPGTPEERAQLAKELRSARREQSESIKGAVEVVDAVGLKIERLALTENAIDPSGGASSQYGSMMGLVGQYFECTFMLDTMHQLYFGPMAAFVKELTREAADSEKRRKIENHWRERDDLMKRMLKDLALKSDHAQQPVEAVKTKNISKMSAAEATKLHTNKV